MSPKKLWSNVKINTLENLTNEIKVKAFDDAISNEKMVKLNNHSKFESLIELILLVTFYRNHKLCSPNIFIYKVQVVYLELAKFLN